MSDPGPREVDGLNGARVGCRVSGSGTFQVTGTAEKSVTAFTLLDGTVTNGGKGTGRITVSSPATAGKQLTSPNDQPCELFVNRLPFQVAPGNIWAEFICPLVTNASQPGSNCGLRGEFVFENCEE